MKVGTVCFATDQGLGYLAKSFYDHGVVTHPVILAHGQRPEHREWYPDGTPYVGTKHGVVQVLLDMKLDAALFFETPFVWDAIPALRRAGVKTVLMPMHECMPDPLPAVPDLFLCPSLLDYEAVYRPERYRMHPEPFKVYCNRVNWAMAFAPVPVEVQRRQRIRCETFVHNAGNGGLRGRNGTVEVLSAWKYVESPAKLVVRSQVPLGSRLEDGRDNRVSFRIGTVPFEQLYAEGDCFVFPEKFNGLSLPLQEAYAAGMLVMATDRFPNTTWLPNGPLLPVVGYNKTRIAPHLAEFDEAVLSPKLIASHIDFWYGRDITEYSEQGRQWAEANSWEKLKPVYMELLQ